MPNIPPSHSLHISKRGSARATQRQAYHELSSSRRRPHFLHLSFSRQTQIKGQVTSQGSFRCNARYARRRWRRWRHSNLPCPACESPRALPPAQFPAGDTPRIKPKDEPTAPKMDRASDWARRRRAGSMSCRATSSTSSAAPIGFRGMDALWYAHIGYRNHQHNADVSYRAAITRSTPKARAT